jgi:transposase
VDLREKIVASVKKGVPKSEAARRFGVHRATVRRYCNQLDERGTLEPRKAPGKRPKGVGDDRSTDGERAGDPA